MFGEQNVRGKNHEFSEGANQDFFSISQINFFGDFGIMAFSYIVFDALQLGTFRISLNSFIKL